MALKLTQRIVVIPVWIVAVLCVCEYVFADNLIDEINGLITLLRDSDSFSNVRSYRPVYNYRSIIQHAARRYRLDPYLLEAIIAVESGYDPTAVSHKGAMGLTQLMPDTAKFLGVRDPFDPYQSIMGGALYYRLLYDRFGNHRAAIYAYHCGPVCVEKKKIPKETKEYFRKVIQAYKRLKKKGGRR